MTSRRHSSPSALPLDDDDLLCEILLRLPPQPSSLPRASAVCKRWRRLLSDPRFLCRFRRHYRRNPPLLSCFVNKFNGLAFVPTMEAPNHIPPERFSLQLDQGGRFLGSGCRHGLALISDQTRHQFIVWDPVTGNHQQLAIPPGLTGVKGAVLRDADGVHFQVVFIEIDSHDTEDGLRAIACVYSSKANEWGNLVSTPIPFEPKTELYPIPSETSISTVPSVLVGDSLYWNLNSSSSSILEFDLEKQSLAVIRAPMDVVLGDFTVIRADGGGLGLLYVLNFLAHLWEKKTDCDGAASWVFGRTIRLDRLLSLNSEKRASSMVIGFAEENNVVILWTSMGLFEVQLQSLQFKMLSKDIFTTQYHPFESVYTAETGIGGGHDATDLLHNGRQSYTYDGMGEKVTVSRTYAEELSGFLQMHHRIKNKADHSQLQDDLVENIWQKFGNE